MVSVYNINPADHALFGLSMELASPVEFAFFIESLVLVMFLGSIGITCAIGMDQFLKKNSMSPQTKKVHRRTFIMLSCQTLSPTILLYAPLCSVYLLVFAGIRSPMDMTCAITFLICSLEKNSLSGICVDKTPYGRFNFDFGLEFGRDIWASRV
nr:unnamed protein product [Haemonchus contortus]